MDRLIEEMKELAERYHAQRLCLFGSRARGDFRPDSDYDFALWGVPAACQPQLLNAVDDLPSLYKIDVVFVDNHTSPALLDNLKKDGVILMDKFTIKRENFESALLRLKEGLAGYETASDQQLARDGIIQRFEFTCELAWKTTREWLLDQGHVELNSPKATMRQAFTYGLIDDEAAWIALLNARNQTSHIYDDATAQEIYDQIGTQYVALFDDLLARLKRES